VSLKEALTDAADAYTRDTGEKVELNFGATGHLLVQVREGAPVDAFIAASVEQMHQAEQQDLVSSDVRTIVGGNSLVLIVPADTKSNLTGFEALADVSVKRLAIGQPRTVPAGQYAAQVLKTLKQQALLAERIVYGSSVRQVLDYVARGEVSAGIVYATDAMQAGGAVRVVATAEGGWHDPIRYVGASVKRSRKSAAVDRFFRFLTGEAAQKCFAERGFSPPTAPDRIGGGNDAANRQAAD
jgi:molybdate transport system substrate-binding protein